MQEVMSSTLAGNDAIQIETVQVNRMDAHVNPQSMSDAGPYDMVLGRQGERQYLNLDSLMLYGKCRVIKLNAQGQETALIATDKCAPINMFGSMFVKDVEIRINDNLLAPSSGNDVNYKNWLETVLSYEPASTGHLQSQIWHMDDVGKFDVIGDGNGGFAERTLYCTGSKYFDFCAPVNADFLKSGNLLGPGNKVDIKIYRAKDEFLLMGAADSQFKLKVIDLRLYYTRVECTLGPRNPELHFMCHTEISRFPLAKGKTNFTLNINTGGVLPRTVIVFFVKTDSYNGEYQLNPLKFEHCNITYLALRVNGHNVPQDGLRPHFPKTGDTVVNTHRGLTARDYLWLFQNSGTQKINRGNLMTYNRFIRDYTMFPFDLSPDFCNGFHTHEATTGMLEVDVRCEALANPTQCMVYCAYDMELALYADGKHEMSYFFASQGPAVGETVKKRKKRRRTYDDDDESD